MRQALSEGRPFVRTGGQARPSPGPLPANPVAGHVYLLTDGACFSACLDFVDLVRPLPGVQHVGLPTSADTVYMEENGAKLPSGLSLLSYAQKVYRHRARPSNVWYRPAITWPGGLMSDTAVATPSPPGG